MKKVLLVVLILTGIILGSVIVYTYNPLVYKNHANVQPVVVISQKQVVGDVTIVNLHGTPYEVGYQHGSLLKSEIYEMIMIADSIIRGSDGLKRLFEDGYLNYVSRSYYQYIPERYRAEMQGIADGAGVQVQEILLLNIFDELYNLSQCTNIAVWGDYTRNGEIIHGRNLDYISAQDLWNKQVVFVYGVNGAKRVVSVGWPGYIGILTGMNESGLSLGSLSSEIEKNSIFGTPSGFLYRSVLENVQNINQVEELLANNRRTIGHNLVITSAQDGKGTVFEITPDFVFSRAPYIRNFVAATNHFEIAAEANRRPNPVESVYRQNRAEEQAAFYAISAVSKEDVVKILDDRVVDGRGTRAIGNYMNVQSVVFLPDSLEIWISINDVVPAAAGVFWGFELTSAKEAPLRYIGKMPVQDTYLTSQFWFNRNTPGYWTEERSNHVLTRYEQREISSMYVQIQKAHFLRKIERFADSISLYQEAISQLGDGEWLNNGDRVYYQRGHYLLFELAQAYQGNSELDKAKESLEELLTKPIYDEHLLSKARLELEKVNNLLK